MRFLNIIVLALIFAAPALYARPLQNFGEQKTTLLRQSQGRLVVLQAWASWCASCPRASQVSFDEVSHIDGARFQSVSIDEDTESASAYLHKHADFFAQLKTSAMIDSEAKSLTELGLKSVPTTLILFHGSVIGKIEGVPEKAKLKALLASAESKK